MALNYGKCYMIEVGKWYIYKHKEDCYPVRISNFGPYSIDMYTQDYELMRFFYTELSELDKIFIKPTKLHRIIYNL